MQSFSAESPIPISLLWEQLVLGEKMHLQLIAPAITYLLPGAINHLNLILSVQVLNFICGEVVPGTVGCTLSLCTCK